MTRFKNRTDAGRQLATRLTDYAHRSDVVILALPRGGVVVAAEVASQLSLPLDVFVVRKLGVPGHSELAMGAIAEGGVQVLSEELIRELGVPPSLVQEVALQESIELSRRSRLYRSDRQPAVIEGRDVILVDDGLATGSTMEAAVRGVRQRAPKAVVVAVPVGARETCARLTTIADRVVCLETPDPFQAVGLWYQDFDQTSDAEVIRLIAGNIFFQGPQSALPNRS